MCENIICKFICVSEFKHTNFFSFSCASSHLKNGAKVRLADPPLVLSTGFLARSAGNHLEKFLLSHVLTEFLSYLFQVIIADKFVAVGVEKFESSLDLSVRVGLTHLGEHDLEKFLEVDSACLLLIKFVDQLGELLLLRVETERAESHLELFGLDGTRATSIKQVKSVLNLFFLLISELLLGSLDLLCVLLLCSSLCLRHNQLLI